MFVTNTNTDLISVQVFFFAICKFALGILRSDNLFIIKSRHLWCWLLDFLYSIKIFLFNYNFLYSIKISSTRRPLWALGRPKRRREDQNLFCSTWRIRSGLFWCIKFSNVFLLWIYIEINDHTCLQGLTGERRYTKSPPKTRSSIFSSKPYNASHYVPAFSSKVSLQLLIFLSKNMSKMH